MSNGAARPSTPMRAITSTLSTRSAPAVPPATQTYEPLVKGVLRHRLLYNILAPSLLYSWALANVWSNWSQGGFAHLGLWGSLVDCISPLTLTQAAFIWLLGVVPALVVRNRFLTATSTPASSPSKMLSAALTKRSTTYALATYLVSGVSLVAMHMLLANFYEPTPSGHPRFSLFVKSRKHPFYVNGRVLYMLFSQITLAFTYLLRTVLLDRFAVRWTQIPAESDAPEKYPFRLARVVTTLITIGLFVGLSTIGYTVLFGLVRSIALPLVYALPYASQFIRPFTAHFLRGPWTITLLVRNWSLVWRTFFVGVTTAACWEFAESPLDETVTVAQATADPALTLVSGITSTDGFFKQFAYAELNHFASEDSPAAGARRSALFADQKYNPNLWTCLCRESLLTLGKDYQLFLRKGEAAPAAAAAPAPPKPATPLPAKATQLIRAPILKGSPTSPLRAALDTLASDGPLSTAVATTADDAASHIPELFRSVMHASPSAERAVEAVQKSEERVVGLLEETRGRWQEGLGAVVKSRAPQPVLALAGDVGHWWTRERVNRKVEMSLPNRRLDALVISVLCHLVCASLTEDRYGVVQRDIPKILEALLSFLSAIEEYQAEVNKLHVPLTEEDIQQLPVKELAQKERLATEVARAGEVLGEVGDAVKSGVGQIARTFGDKLAAFKFPPRIAQKLQGYVDYA
ncbi:nucleoporin protein Ndc1-Nup [Fomitopsis serialis]|uniref:nucleoporin protein Ndc1-Nup n=1 Tax=Fomitopsis serialis TaxID=139415 RepID=UPI0020082139|nr:nucleoporin protein Ndc1-Nup [Neoantrodia serialis]KAH9918053.1 nucleoporin protein Ndc1-Nup [Neoantrodia serialis]